MGVPIGPGDWVECIDAAARVWFPPEEQLTNGAVYCVAECFTDARGHSVFALVGKERVYGSRYVGFRLGYAIWRFRPIYPGGALIRKLMEKLPEKIDA